MDLKSCFVVSSHSHPLLLSCITQHSVEERCLGDCALGEGMYLQCVTFFFQFYR